MCFCDWVNTIHNCLTSLDSHVMYLAISNVWKAIFASKALANYMPVKLYTWFGKSCLDDTQSNSHLYVSQHRRRRVPFRIQVSGCRPMGIHPARMRVLCKLILQNGLAHCQFFS